MACMGTTLRVIALTRAERATLRTLLTKGRHNARELMRARVLLKSADGMAHTLQEMNR